VLRDLVVSGWPPAYGNAGGAEFILRTPVAYYLPAAVLGKIFGLRHADFLLFLWTAVGVFLFLLIAFSTARTKRHVGIGAIVIVLFSGMDVFGTKRYFLDHPDLTEHLEWWAHLFQYSSNTTQLFWVPNHALPGWLMAALIYKHWRNPNFFRIAPIAFAVTPLWSPLVTIGLAPFAIALAVLHLRPSTWRANVIPWVWVASFITFAATAYYLVLDSSRIGSRWITSGVFSYDALLLLYTKFVLFEFGLLALAICLIRRNLLITLSVGVLLVLPLYAFGPGNDLAMRASIPALTILCLAAIDALSDMDWSARPQIVMPLLLCLTFGAFTAIHEIARAILVPRWSAQLGRNLLEASHGMPAHYVARLSPVLAHIMRPPQRVPGLQVQQLSTLTSSGQSSKK
jgi:hypothetical protein